MCHYHHSQSVKSSQLAIPDYLINLVTLPCLRDIFLSLVQTRQLAGFLCVPCLLIYYLSINFEENRDASYVVDHRIVFFPLLRTRPHNCVARLLGTVFNVVRPDDASDLFVRKEFPNAVTGDYNKLVRRLEQQLFYLWLPRHPN